MAKVVQDPKLRQQIDRFLDYLVSEWESIPEDAAEWDKWDQASKTDFALDWPIREDRLHQIQRYAEQGLLTPEQRARYDEVLRLVAQNRSILEQMLSDSRP